MTKTFRVLLRTQQQSKSNTPSLPSVRDETEAMDEIHEQFRALRVRALPRPKKSDGELLEPVLPRNLTDLTDEELGDLLGDFTRMIQYVRPRLAMKSVFLAIQRRRERVIRAQVRTGKRGTVQDKDGQTDIDARTREAGFEVLVAEGTHTMVEAVLDGYIAGRDTVSREITRRKDAP